MADQVRWISRAAGNEHILRLKETEKFMHIPYEHGGRNENGIDCYGLGVLLYRHFFDIDIDTLKSPSKGNAYINGIKKAYDTVVSEWRRVEVPSFLDVIAFDTVHIKNRQIVSHIGFFYKTNMMLHISETTKFPCVEKISNYGHTIIGYYRHAKLFESDLCIQSI